MFVIIIMYVVVMIIYIYIIYIYYYIIYIYIHKAAIRDLIGNRITKKFRKPQELE